MIELGGEWASGWVDDRGTEDEEGYLLLTRSQTFAFNLTLQSQVTGIHIICSI